jgi:hypothetical protein
MVTKNLLPAPTLRSWINFFRKTTSNLKSHVGHRIQSEIVLFGVSGGDRDMYSSARQGIKTRKTLDEVLNMHF